MSHIRTNHDLRITDNARATVIEQLFVVGPGATVNNGDAVYVKPDGTIDLADSSSEVTSLSTVGVVKSDIAVSDGSSASVVLSGLVQSAFSGFLSGQKIFVSTAGTTGATLVQAGGGTMPSLPGEILLEIGVGEGSTAIIVGRQQPIELT